MWGASRRIGRKYAFSMENNLDVVDAAKQGLLEQVIECIERTVSQNSRKLDKALTQAAMYGHAEVMSVLLEAGSDVNARDTSGSSHLFRVIVSDFPECLAVLLNHGADVNARNTYGDTALHEACGHCRESCLHVLLSREDINIDVQNNCGLSPLMLAAKSLFVNGVKALVRRACDVNLVSTSRKTAVLYCLCTEYPLQHDQGRRMGGAHKLACLHVLVRAKADVNWSDREGFTALHYAVKTGSLECVRLLVDENCDLNRHAFFGQVSPQKLRTVLCRGDRDTPVTAFLLSVYYGDVDVTRLLVQHGCVYHDCQFVLPYLTIQGAMYRYLVGAFREVRSLRTLCVMTIRQSVGADVNYKAGRLNLPDVLQKAVCDPLKI